MKEFFEFRHDAKSDWRARSESRKIDLDALTLLLVNRVTSGRVPLRLSLVALLPFGPDSDYVAVARQGDEDVFRGLVVDGTTARMLDFDPYRILLQSGRGDFRWIEEATEGWQSAETHDPIERADEGYLAEARSALVKHRAASGPKGYWSVLPRRTTPSESAGTVFSVDAPKPNPDDSGQAGGEALDGSSAGVDPARLSSIVDKLDGLRSSLDSLLLRQQEAEQRWSDQQRKLEREGHDVQNRVQSAVDGFEKTLLEVHQHSLRQVSAAEEAGPPPRYLTRREAYLGWISTILLLTVVIFSSGLILRQLDPPDVVPISVIGEIREEPTEWVAEDSETAKDPSPEDDVPTKKQAPPQQRALNPQDSTGADRAGSSSASKPPAAKKIGRQESPDTDPPKAPPPSDSGAIEAQEVKTASGVSEIKEGGGAGFRRESVTESSTDTDSPAESPEGRDIPQARESESDREGQGEAEASGEGDSQEEAEASGEGESQEGEGEEGEMGGPRNS